MYNLLFVSSIAKSVKVQFTKVKSANTKSSFNISLHANLRGIVSSLLYPPVTILVLVIVTIAGPISNDSGIVSAKALIISVNAVFKPVSIPVLFIIAIYGSINLVGSTVFNLPLIGAPLKSKLLLSPLRYNLLVSTVPVKLANVIAFSSSVAPVVLIVNTGSAGILTVIAVATAGKSSASLAVNVIEAVSLIFSITLSYSVSSCVIVIVSPTATPAPIKSAICPLFKNGETSATSEFPSNTSKVNVCV